MKSRRPIQAIPSILYLVGTYKYAADQVLGTSSYGTDKLPCSRFLSAHSRTDAKSHRDLKAVTCGPMTLIRAFAPICAESNWNIGLEGIGINDSPCLRARGCNNTRWLFERSSCEVRLHALSLNMIRRLCTLLLAWLPNDAHHESSVTPIETRLSQVGVWRMRILHVQEFG